MNHDPGTPRDRTHGHPGGPSTPTTAGPRSVSWPLALALGTLALLRPLMNATGITDMIGAPWAQLGATLLITVVWILAVLVSRAPRPFLTLVCAGLTYGILAIVVSAALSPLLLGETQGPITDPLAMVAVLVTNALWGAVAGALALAVRRLTQDRGKAG
ncbi:hypothetical protein [Nocardiopsis alkaliphila]|uniref:hypothetical protein n=1 Tax=Nocardiopsis alkaliphila TaxID=225762 RepID=UPI0003789EB3|nr:hypothetical protein [Nocardiopsis alkaliphila]